MFLWNFEFTTKENKQLPRVPQKTLVAQKVAAEEELERLERSVVEKTIEVQQQRRELKVNQINEQYNKF